MSGLASPPTEILVRQGYEQLTAGRYEEAVETLSAALAMTPGEAQALRGRGLARVQLKHWPLAAADFRAARDQAPADLDNWIDLGTSLSMDQQIYPALAIFDRLLADHPDCVRGHIEVGLLHIRLGAISKGRTHLQIALARRPTLAQRRFIESMLHEQERLDRKRYYRPDFEALRRQQRQRPPWAVWMEKARGALKQRFGRATP